MADPTYQGPIRIDPRDCVAYPDLIGTQVFGQVKDNPHEGEVYGKELEIIYEDNQNLSSDDASSGSLL